MLAKVKGNELECYGWLDGEELELVNEIPEDLPEKIYRAKNINRNEYGAVLEHQIEKINNSSGVKCVSYFDKLKLQIDNLELMYEQHSNGADVSSMVYWQIETINEILRSLESVTGANDVRKVYEELI